MITAEQMCRIPSWLANRGPESAIVTSTRIRLARNLVDSAFPVRASLQERKIVFDRVVEACQRVAQCRDFTVTNFAPLRPLAQQFLMEERAASLEKQRREDKELATELICTSGILSAM